MKPPHIFEISNLKEKEEKRARIFFFKQQDLNIEYSQSQTQKYILNLFL